MEDAGGVAPAEVMCTRPDAGDSDQQRGVSVCEGGGGVGVEVATSGAGSAAGGVGGCDAWRQRRGCEDEDSDKQ